MSIKSATGNAIASKTLKAGINTTPWVRNPSWLSLPSVSGLQKLAGLYRIDTDSSFATVFATTAYTIDWGDGSATENIGSGSQGYHLYDFSTYDVSKTTMGAVTFTDSGDVVGRTAHGHSNGDVVRFYNIVSTTGLTEATAYYVINKATDTFQVSLTLGGSAVALTTDGSGTLLPYKQAIITIVPNGGNLTSIDISRKHSKTGLQNGIASGWLDVSVEGSYLTSLIISSTSLSTTPLYLEQVSVTGTNSITSLAGCFYGARKLQSIPSLATGTLTTVASAFKFCEFLITAPFLNTASVTSFADLFSSCFSLVNVPAYNTVSGTNFSNCFNSCFALKNLPYWNTAAATNFNFMFTSAINLKVIPLYNTANVTNFANCFDSCYSLETIPKLNTASGTNFASFFSSCYSLKEIPVLNTSNGTAFNAFAYGCYALQSFPLIDTAKGTTFNQMFYNAKSLKTIPLLDTHLGVTTAFSAMMQGCTSLTSMPLIDTSGGVDFSSMFKQCTSLTTIPKINTSNGTNFSAMFAEAVNLESIPLIDTSKGTNMSSLFYVISYGVTQIGSIPKLDFSSSTNNGSLWWDAANCYKATFSGTKATINYAGAKLSVAALEDIFINLGLGTSQTITISSNHGAATPVAVTNCNATADTYVISNISSTTGITVGDQISGTNTPITTGITATVATNALTISPTNSFVAGDMIAFSANAPSGLSNFVIYYVRDVSGYSIGLAATSGGTALTWASASTCTIKYICKVVSIVPNTSVTVDRVLPVQLSGVTVSFRPLRTGIALMKNWTCTG